MTEQTVPVTPEATETTSAPESPVVEQKKRFRFSKKQTAIAGATIVAAAAAVYLKVKSSASKLTAENSENETSTPESETDASV